MPFPEQHEDNTTQPIQASYSIRCVDETTKN